MVTSRATLVRKELQARRHREQIFPPKTFSDPAWDMLLILYAAHLENRAVRVSTFCTSTPVLMTTVLRWIENFLAAGLCNRGFDTEDRRVTLISLTDLGADRMNEYFAHPGGTPDPASVFVDKPTILETIPVQVLADALAKRLRTSK